MDYDYEQNENLLNHIGIFSEYFLGVIDKSIIASINKFDVFQYADGYLESNFVA